MALNVGLVGLKGHQGVVTGSIPHVPGVRLAGVCEDDPEKLAGVSGWACADADTHTYTDFGEMLEREQLDIVAEAGTDDQRAQIVVECLDRGIHVLCEKPLAKQAKELEEIRAAYEDSETLLSMLLTMRFEPPYRAIRDMIAKGAIGEVCLATMQKSYRLGDRPEWQRDHRTFSGIIPFIGIHALDCIRWTTGQEFTQVMAYQGNTGHPDLRDMEDNACLALRLSNGGSAAVRLDYCRPAAAPTHGDDRLRVAGNRGVIEWLYVADELTLITEEEGPRTVPLPERVDQFANFVAAARGEAECEVSAQDAMLITEVALKARWAAQTGKAVRL